MAFATAEPLRPPRAGRVRSARIELADGARTMVHVAAPRRVAGRAAGGSSCAVRRALEPWCAARGVEEALVGGFFVARTATPLGEVRTRGVARRHVAVRRALERHPGVRARPRRRREHRAAATSCPPQPRGDLLQAGPLLVRDGRAGVPAAMDDREGFRAGMAQFDSDITDGRYPRAALGLADGHLFAVACDGRGRFDAGLTLEELAALMAALGRSTALNLDGGGSTSLVSGGRLRNRPRGRGSGPSSGAARVHRAPVRP